MAPSEPEALKAPLQEQDQCVKTSAFEPSPKDKEEVTLLEEPPVQMAVYLYAACAALNSVNLGYDIGINANAAKLVQDSMGLSDVQIQAFNGSLNLFAMIGAMGAHWICDSLGRRRSFQVSAVCFIIGVTPMALASSYSMLLFGKVFVGLGVGFGLAIDPVYISEISPAAHRGRLVTWSEIAINTGILLGLSSGLLFHKIDPDLAWRFMFAMGAILPPVLYLLAGFVMPESPRWLVQTDQIHQATAILEKLYPPNTDIEQVIADIKHSIHTEIAAEHAVGWGIIFHPSPAFKRMLIVGIGTAAAAQAVGIEALLYYLVYIIEESNVNSRIMQSLILIFLGLVKLVFIVLAGSLYDTKGRRPLFFASLAGMTIALLMLAFNFIAHRNASFVVVSLALYLASYSIGMGPGGWLIPSEVFTNTIRAKAMSIATFLNRLTATIMASTFLSVANLITWSGFFVLLACICIAIAVFIYFYLPETKGLKLEDMALYFAEITGDESILELEQSLEKQAAEKSSEPTHHDEYGDYHPFSDRIASP